jgi:hypothetical protein
VDASAEEIYLAMPRHPQAGSAALARRLGCNRADGDAALDELTRLCLLRPSWEDPQVMRPVSPSIGLEALLVRQQADLLRRQHQIEEGRAALEALVVEFAGHGGGSGTTAVEELIGLDAVREGLERLAWGPARRCSPSPPTGHRPPTR